MLMTLFVVGNRE